MKLPTAAREWPLLECLIAEKWQDTAQISQVLIARNAPGGRIAVGSFVVDLGCLGVKNTMSHVFESDYEYRQVRGSFLFRQSMVPCDLNLAAKVIAEAVAYARSLGFEPHRDYRRAVPILGDANPHECRVTIPLGGQEGKPLFFAGPYDNVARVIATLDQSVGPDGYHLLVPLEDDRDAFPDI